MKKGRSEFAALIGIDRGYVNFRELHFFLEYREDDFQALLTSTRQVALSVSRARNPSSGVLSTWGIRNLHGAPEGEAPRGKRAYGKVPRNRGKNTTLIAAITLDGAMGESMTVEGATDALASKPASSTS